MSQTRKSKAIPAVKPVPIGNNTMKDRSSKARTGHEIRSQSIHPNNESRKNRSKIKIPKSVRYDLENALVGLCDVWFEEIKPHLVRNNIKLHVHDSGKNSSTTSTDYDQQSTGGYNCSHIDPASSADSCMLCQLLCNAANSIGSALSQAASLQQLSSAGSNTTVAIANATQPPSEVPEL